MSHKPAAPKATRMCKHCGKTFTPKKPWQLYDTSTCRWADWDKTHPRTKSRLAG
jgi:hypothetical protein